MRKILFYLLSVTILLYSCKKDETPAYNPNVNGELSVEFDNIVGGADLQLNSGNYTNTVGENFKVSKLKYYVSNFVFTKKDGAVFTIPQAESYFLIDEENTSSRNAQFRVPEGEYKTVSFLLGIDSLRSTMDISQRTGVLDPTAAGGDMYWSWNSGYIFFKMEGSSPASPEMGNMFMYHIGGFGGYSSPTLNNIKKITLDLTNRGMPQVKSGKQTNVHLMVDILKMFGGATTVSIATNPAVMFNEFSAGIANNYTAMFTHDHTEN